MIGTTRDHLVRGAVKLLQARGRSRNCVTPQPRRIERGAHIVSADSDSEFPLDDELSIEKARVPAADEMRQDFECFRLTWRARCVGGHEEHALMCRLFDFRIG